MSFLGKINFFLSSYLNPYIGASAVRSNFYGIVNLMAQNSLKYMTNFMSKDVIIANLLVTTTKIA